MTTHAALTWTMNFAAGCRELIPLFADNTCGRIPSVHPMFLASCSEIIGAWGCLYAAGVTKPEVVKHTFVHWKFDSIFHRPLLADDTVTTKITLVGVGNRRSGGHFSAKFVHRDLMGVIGESWWDGIVLGLAAQGADRYIDQPPPLLRVSKPHNANKSVSLIVTAAQAHVWDACVRNPRKLKSKSADINVHTNVAYAVKAGLPARTLNGLCVLSLALSKLLETIGHPDAWNAVQRVTCTFGAPVFIRYDPVSLRVVILESGFAKDLPLWLIAFEVLTHEGNKAVRDGYLELNSAAFASPKL